MGDHAGSSNARPVVIVIDDDAGVRNSLKFSLELEGLTVRLFSSPDDFLSDGDIAAGSCLVVDQNMPGMSGLNLLAELRSRGVTTPAILVSAHVTAALRHEAALKELPIVEKPFLGNGLFDRIQDAISQNRR
jgi:FixJ family two-component response regulator